MNLVSSGTGHWNWTGSWEKNTDMIFEEKRELAIRATRREEGRRKGKERSGGGGYLRGGVEEQMWGPRKNKSIAGVRELCLIKLYYVFFIFFTF